ncbi:hypothetical protein NQ315_009357 [Exocentrus adspersus]|uniref:Cilia- and flagella-associated protein 53 n=1 Tax=Exocentrus adspersus TaxID=1586481 RepID=A0AAV8WGM8_9CUCU|nr:hypothetical protein NQ315_009357 [Exocentrus adspersus]
MFGNELVIPKPDKTKPRYVHDIQLPGIEPGHYQHVQREPNTNYDVQMFNYNHKKQWIQDNKINALKADYLNQTGTNKYEVHTEKAYMKRLIQEKVQKKIEEYEKSVEERRERLRELFIKEEREFYYETVDQAQKGDEKRMEETKRRAELLRAETEAKRLELVQMKRTQQYRNRCQELRPFLEKKHTVESKSAQLQQIRENEARRESERELDRMWHNLMMKELEAKVEREQQDAMKEKQHQEELLEVWNMQVKGKELLKEEVAKVAEEDRMEMLKLNETLKKEKIEAEQEKIRKREQTAKDLLGQLSDQRQLLAQRRKEEHALNEAFGKLAQLELEKEKQSFKDSSTQAKRESALYRKHLKELAEARKREEEQLEKMLNEYQKEVQKKQDEARCKVVEAKRKLHEGVLKERAEQLALKRQQAEQQLKEKQAENELLRIVFERNNCLQDQSDRLEKLAAQQYREDLLKQIEYNNLLRQKEREELERQLRNGMEEEEQYKQFAQKAIKEMSDLGGKHPFRRVLEKYDCRCPPYNQ